LYAIWVLDVTSVQYITSTYKPDIYASLSWRDYTIDVIVRFLVIWEVFRQTFPRSSWLNKSLSRGLGIIAFGLLLFGCALFWGYQNYSGIRSLHLALDRTFG